MITEKFKAWEYIDEKCHPDLSTVRYLQCHPRTAIKKEITQPSKTSNTCIIYCCIYWIV